MHFCPGEIWWSKSSQKGGTSGILQRLKNAQAKTQADDKLKLSPGTGLSPAQPGQWLNAVWTSYRKTRTPKVIGRQPNVEYPENLGMPKLVQIQKGKVSHRYVDVPARKVIQMCIQDPHELPLYSKNLQAELKSCRCVASSLGRRRMLSNSSPSRRCKTSFVF